MIARFGHWLGQHFSQAMAWFAGQSAWVQFVIVICVALVVVGLAHVDELRRAREWREFRLWRESQRRPLKGMKR